MRGEEENDLRQTRGGEYSGSALRGHWNNTEDEAGLEDTTLNDQTLKVPAELSAIV